MDTAQFLRRILPASGLYVIARLTSKGFKHQICESIEEAAAYALQFDAQGVATYHACASFREREVVEQRPDGTTWRRVRIHKNVLGVRSFFMDLDVETGNDKKFASQEEALGDLVTFCASTGLPIPLIVSSGGGVHVYWPLTRDVIPEQWKPVAESLKALCAHHKFKADSAVTADSARVLRPVGTWNRKTNPPRPVELVADAEPIEFSHFSALVAAAAKRAGFKPPEGVRQVEAKTETINQQFAIQRDFPPCSGVRVAEKCRQVGAMRDTKGNIPEPHWYAALQLLTRSTEGDALIHEWSNGHAQYSAEETNRKIAQVRSQALGPTLCTTFESRVPGGCEGCPFKGKISTPAQLGAQIASAPPPTIEVVVSEQVVTVTLPNPPAPFTRGAAGGIYVEKDGISHKVYEYDVFPVEIAFDEQLGFETVRIRHFMPQEGWKECVVQSSLLARPVDFEATLRGQHIQPLIRNEMAGYMDAYMRKLRTDTKLRKLFRSQGWKEDDTEFVLGDRLYRAGETVQAGFSHGAKGFLDHFRQKGSLAPWRDLTYAFNAPSLEPHAFMLLVAFAAPLLQLARRKGFTICALGDTGTGKSTMAGFMASVYGHPEKTWAGMNDTSAARYERLGAYYSIPVYVDEASTIDPDELRTLIYAVATGKGRGSLKQDRTFREGAEWATVLVTSTNDSLQSKLQIAKQNAEAESMRLFEFRFPRVSAFGEVAKLVPQVVAENYGVAGARYIEYVVNNLARVKAEANALVLATESSFGMDPKERFWQQAVALSIYGGQLAREAGVIDFDPNCIKTWLFHETQTMRKIVSDNRVGAPAVLAQYLDAHIGERIVVSAINSVMGAMGARPTRGALSQRYEPALNTVWVPVKHVREWLTKHHFDFASTRDELIAKGILKATAEHKTLGGGTDYAGGSVACWRIRTDHPELSLQMEAA